MAPSKKCFPLQPGAFFRFSRIFKLSQSAYTSNLPFSKLCFLPKRGTQFCFFPLLTISPKTCKSNLSAFPPFLNAVWGLLKSPWAGLGPSWRQGSHKDPHTIEKPDLKTPRPGLHVRRVLASGIEKNTNSKTQKNASRCDFG